MADTYKKTYLLYVHTSRGNNVFIADLHVRLIASFARLSAFQSETERQTDKLSFIDNMFKRRCHRKVERRQVAEKKHSCLQINMTHVNYDKVISYHTDFCTTNNLDRQTASAEEDSVSWSKRYA